MTPAAVCRGQAEPAEALICAARDNPAMVCPLLLVAALAAAAREPVFVDAGLASAVCAVEALAFAPAAVAADAE